MTFKQSPPVKSNPSIHTHCWIILGQRQRSDLRKSLILASGMPGTFYLPGTFCLPGTFSPKMIIGLGFCNDFYQFWAARSFWKTQDLNYKWTPIGKFYKVGSGALNVRFMARARKTHIWLACSPISFLVFLFAVNGSVRKQTVWGNDNLFY